MATNRRDVEVALRVKTEGSEDVRGLAGDLRNLAGEGAGLDSAFGGGSAALAELTAQTARLREEEKATRDELRRMQRELQDKRDALERLRITQKAAGGDTAAFRVEEGKLREELLNARSAIRQKREALDLAANASKAAAAAERNLSTELERSSKAAADATKTASAGLETVSRAGLDASDTLRQLGPLIATAFSARQFVETIAASESLGRSFEQIFGSAGRAREELDFIRVTANRLGLENLDLARSYQSLAAATKGTTLEGQQTREVFEAVARAMSTLGKSSAETDRALTAVAQIASKGTASMEELRGQLGEALPGALQATAAGAGVTVEQLVEMVSTGQVLAKDVLPALTKGLGDLYGKAAPPQTITSEWARLKNVLTDTAVALGEGGASRGITKALGAAAIAAQGFSAIVDVMGTAVGETAAAIVTGNTAVSEGEALANKHADALRKAAETAGFVEKAQVGLTAAQNAGNQTAGEAFRALERLAAKQEQAGESMLKVRARYADLVKGADTYTQQIEKELVARRDEAAALVQFANLAGSETEQRQVATAASASQLIAAKRLAEAREVEAIIAQSLAIRLQEEAQRRGDNTEATRKDIEAAQRNAAAKNTAAEAAKAAAVSKRIEAEAVRVSALAYEDNAARVDEYRAAAVEAAREVERFVALQKQGKATDDQITEARAKAAGATRLYRDALSDATDAAERRLNSERQQAQAAQASAAVDIERVRATREVAIANGDATRASALQREETTLQVQAAFAFADASRREAQLIREVTDKKEAQARATGELTTKKRDEIDAARRSADLKDLEAEKADILAQKTRDLAESTQARTASLEEEIAVQERALDLARRQQALEERRRTAFDTAGNVVTASADTPMSVANTLQGYGMTPEQAQRAAAQFFNANGTLNYGAGNSLGASSLSETLQRLAQRQQQSPASAPVAAATTRTVNINIGGRTAAVNVASQQDANALAEIFRQLEAASGRAI